MKTYFVFSDIHGHFDQLIHALEDAQFDLENKDHILLCLGDWFDRGNQNLKLVGFIKYFSRMNRLISIRGNHDDFLLNFLTGKDDGTFNIRYNGMGSTLIELADKDANTIEKIRDSINENHPYLIDLLSSFIDQFELGKYVFTHAGYTFSEDKGWYLYNFSKTPLFVRDFDPKVKVYVFGHFHASVFNHYYLGIESDEPYVSDHFIGIDSRVVISKKVHVLTFSEDGIWLNEDMYKKTRI